MVFIISFVVIEWFKFFSENKIFYVLYMIKMKKILFISLLCIVIFIVWCWSSSIKQTWTCIDVTSYDRNWDNDMKCTSSNWEVQYTSYEWAKMLMSL